MGHPAGDLFAEAGFEAVERGLVDEPHVFTAPYPVWLDALTLVDLTTGPPGLSVPGRRTHRRVLERYIPEQLPHRSVTTGYADLLAAVARAAQRLGLPPEDHPTAVPHHQ